MSEGFRPNAVDRLASFKEQPMRTWDQMNIALRDDQVPRNHRWYRAQRREVSLSSLRGVAAIAMLICRRPFLCGEVASPSAGGSFGALTRSNVSRL